METAGVIIAAIGVVVAIVFGILQLLKTAKPTPTVAPTPIIPPAPPPEPEPRIVTHAEYEARVRNLRNEWEIRAPTADRARGRYLQEGWERDEIGGHPLVYESLSGNWLVRRRPPVHGLNDAAIAALVAMRRNTYRRDTFQYISGGSMDHLVTSIREWAGDEAMAIREQLLNRGLVTREPQEFNYYILTEVGRNEAERLIQAGAPP